MSIKQERLDTLINNSEVIEQMNELDPFYEYDIKYSQKIDLEGLTQEMIDDPNYDLGKHKLGFSWEIIRREKK
tara:strand:- start:332 stop:550 length:219 start_codon:yes stop_codon:yes gene_type:complete